MQTRSHAPAKALKVLEISASGRRGASVSRLLTQELIDALGAREGELQLTRRDLSAGVPFIDEAWINANFTPSESRNAEQRAVLRLSDTLVEELVNADVVVIGTPVYNFGVPAALKAWVDLVARARLTFRYTDMGPEGLLRGKKAYIVYASGGVPVGSGADFATPYLRHVLKFVGIDDVDVIAAAELNRRRDEAIETARARIGELVGPVPARTSRAA